MQNSKGSNKEKQGLSNNIILVQPDEVLVGAPAESLIKQLVYSSEVANDHVFHELEARYGAVLALHIMGMMPK